MSSPKKTRKLAITWPLFHGEQEPPFPADPTQVVAEHAPPSAELRALSRQVDLPESAVSPEELVQRLRSSLPPPSVDPEWMRAAQALIAELNQLIARGSVSPSEHAAIARAWAAWSLGGVSETEVLRVAHLVNRAHAAVRDSTQTGPDLHAALRAAAGVLHSCLPSSLKQRMPLQRAVVVVYHLREAADAWTAVVEGTADLLGWNDYARSHAAAVIRRVLERAREQPG